MLGAKISQPLYLTRTSIKSDLGLTIFHKSPGPLWMEANPQQEGLEVAQQFQISNSRPRTQGALSINEEGPKLPEQFQGKCKELILRAF